MTIIVAILIQLIKISRVKKLPKKNILTSKFSEVRSEISLSNPHATPDQIYFLGSCFKCSRIDHKQLIGLFNDLLWLLELLTKPILDNFLHFMLTDSIILMIIKENSPYYWTLKLAISKSFVIAFSSREEQIENISY